jgi:hypothetical protein
MTVRAASSCQFLLRSAPVAQVMEEGGSKFANRILQALAVLHEAGHDFAMQGQRKT